MKIVDSIKNKIRFIHHFIQLTPQDKAVAIRALLDELNLAQKFYIAGFFYLGLTCFLWFFYDVFLGRPLPETVFAFWFSILFLNSGLIIESIALYNKIWDSSPGKAFILIAFAFTTNITFSMASQIVNEVLKADAAAFTYTLSFVVILLIPAVFSVVVYLIASTVLFLGGTYFGIRGIILSTINSSHRKEQILTVLRLKEKPFNRITLSGRIIAILTLLYTLSFIGQQYQKYENALKTLTGTFAFHLEMQKHSYCKKDEQNKVARIDDNAILIGSKNTLGEYNFVREKCVSTL